MSRDGFRDYTLDQVREIATRAVRELDGRNGDPSRAADWTRERRLAWFVLALVARAEAAGLSIEVKS